MRESAGGTRAKRQHTPDYKLQVVREVFRGGKSLSQIGREQNLAQNVLRRSRQAYAEGVEGAFGASSNGDGKSPTRVPAADIRF